MATTSRREFLRATAVVTAAVPVLSRCGGATDPAVDAGALEDAALDDGGDPACTGGTRSTIASNHGHLLEVPRADVEAGVPVTYDIQGSALHNHTVAVDADAFVRLARGETLQLTSSDDALHSHAVTLRCA